jgi:uncharacterized protein (DUF111 family)
VRSGFGAGTKDFPGRANALRIILADVERRPVRDTTHEQLAMLACDVDDMSPEYLAGTAERLRADGALDVVLLHVSMKKGRLGTRIEVLSRPDDASRIEQQLLSETTTLGVRRLDVTRITLPRRFEEVDVLGYTVRIKTVRLPDGSERSKPEHDDVQRVALATGRRAADIYQLALAIPERRQMERVPSSGR